VANRGHDSIAIFSVKEGWLSRQGWSYTERTPWDFALSRDERFLIVANTTSGSVTVYPRSGESGELGPLCGRVAIEKACCITLV